MRTLLVAMAAVVAGIAAGWGITAAEFKNSAPVVIPDPAPVSGAPRVQVEGGETFEFGGMEANTTRDYTFVFRNVGDAPLQLTKGNTTCKCTISEVDDSAIAPGETREVKLEWTPKAVEARFEQKATIVTNDPTRRTVDLIIRGQVRDNIKIEPTHLTLGQVSSSEGTTQQVKIWSYQDEPLEYKGFKITSSEHAEFYEIEATPMSDAEVAEVKDAKSGLLLRVHVKPGVPLGNLHHSLKIEHNYADRDPFDLPVSGRSVGDITLVGEAYDPDRDYLALGNIPSSQGRKVKAFLFVKGPHRDEVRLKVKSIDPADALQVEIGEAKSAGKTITYPLNIEIPPGAMPVSRIGTESAKLARIELETQHPTIETFTVRLRFAITGD